MDSNEQQQAGAGGAGSGGFGFNPFGDSFWSGFGGKGGPGGQQGPGNIDDLFKEFEQFFSMNEKQGAGSSARGSSNAGKAKGKDVNVIAFIPI